MGARGAPLTTIERVRLLGARAELDDAARRELTALVERPLDWSSIIRSSRRDGTAALLDHHVTATAGVAERLPPTALAALRRATRDAWARNTVLAAAWREAVAALRAAGVPVITLKGMALAHRVYADPALRPMADMDLLVHPEDVAAARHALGALGFRAADPPLEAEWALRRAMPLVRGPAVIDLHWHVASYPRYEHAVAVDHAGLWARSREEPLGGTRASVLAVEDDLLHVVLHLTIGSEFGRLIWFTDVDRIVRHAGPTLDWRAVRERAMAWRVAGLLRFVLDVVRSSLGTPVPAGAVGRAGPGPGRRRVVGALLNGDRPPPLAWDGPGLGVYPAEALLMDRPRDVVRVAASAVVPPLGWITSHYGVRGWRRHVYRALHPGRVLFLAARALAGRGRPAAEGTAPR